MKKPERLVSLLLYLNRFQCCSGSTVDFEQINAGCVKLDQSLSRTK